MESIQLRDQSSLAISSQPLNYYLCNLLWNERVIVWKWPEKNEMQNEMPGPWIEHGTSRMLRFFSLLLSQLSYPGDNNLAFLRIITRAIPFVHLHIHPLS